MLDHRRRRGLGFGLSAQGLDLGTFLDSFDRGHVQLNRRTDQRRFVRFYHDGQRGFGFGLERTDGFRSDPGCDLSHGAGRLTTNTTALRFGGDHRRGVGRFFGRNHHGHRRVGRAIGRHAFTGGAGLDLDLVAQAALGAPIGAATPAATAGKCA